MHLAFAVCKRNARSIYIEVQFFYLNTLFNHTIFSIVHKFLRRKTTAATGDSPQRPAPPDLLLRHIPSLHYFSIQAPEVRKNVGEKQ